MIAVSRLFLFLFFFSAGICFSQSSSFGPGKASLGKSIYTYPQPPKRAPWGPEKIQPAYEIPETPEKYIWKLTTKNLGMETKSSDIPIFSFDPVSGRRTMVGTAKIGEEVTWDEILGADGRHFYRIKWSAAPTNPNLSGSEPAYWIDGRYIEYAGKK